MRKAAKGNIAAKAAESKAFTQRLIADEKAKWLEKNEDAKAAAKAKTDAELDEWAQRADVNSSTSVNEDQRSVEDEGAPQEVQDHESQPKGALSKPIKKKLEAMADIDSDTEYVDTTGPSKKKRSSKNNANLPKKSRFSPRDDHNPFLANHSEGENHPTNPPQRERGYGMMPTVITATIKPLSDLGPKLKASDWRAHQVECSRATTNVPSAQARAMRNNSISDNNWMMVGMLLSLKQEQWQEHHTLSVDQLKELDHDEFFQVVLSLYIEEQGQAAPELSEKLKRMNLGYMVNRGPQDGLQVAHDIVKTMLDLGLIAQQSMTAAHHYFDENPTVSSNCIRVMSERLRLNNVHGKPTGDLTEAEQAEAAKVYRLWTTFYFGELDNCMRLARESEPKVNFVYWLNHWCRLINYCAEQRRSALQAGFFTESPTRNPTKGPKTSSSTAPKQSSGAGAKRSASSTGPKRPSQGAPATGDKRPCEGCGKDHAKGLTLAQISKGHTSDCQFHKHPDFNKSGKPWKESPIGKALSTQKEGYQSLSHHYQLVNNVWQRVKVNIPITQVVNQMYNTDNVIDRNLIPQSEDDHDRSEENTCINHNNLSHMLNHMKNINNLLIFKLNLITSSGNLPHLFCKIKIGNLTNKCKALLDTGSGATFVSQRLINDLKIKTRQIKPVGVQTYDGNVQRTTTAVNLRNVSLDRTQDEHDIEYTTGIQQSPSCGGDSQFSSDGTAVEGTSPTSKPNGKARSKPKRGRNRSRDVPVTKPGGTYIRGEPETKIPKVSGIGRINTVAIVLPDLEKSGFDIIIGYPLIRRYGLTRVFEELFNGKAGYDSEPVPIAEVHSVKGTPTPVSPKRARTANLASEIPAHGNASSTATTDTVTEDLVLGTAGPTHIQVEWEDTSAISSTIGLHILVPEGGHSDTGHGLYLKEQLLDPVAPDDDMIDRMQGDSAWDKYFNEAQTEKPDTGSSQSRSTKTLGLTIREILERSQIEGTPEDKVLIGQCIEKNQDRFAEKVHRIAATLPPFELDVNKSEWENGNSCRYPRPQALAKQDACDNFVRKAIADGLIRPSQASQFSQVLLTPKANGTWRFCVDYRRLNTMTKSMGWPIPNIESLLQRIGQRCQRGIAKYFATLDFTSGYHQAPLAENSRAYTAFIVGGSEQGVYEWCRVPMGPKGAPSYFQQQMQRTVFKELLGTVMEIYIDDILIWGDTVGQLTENLNKVFARMREYNLTVNPEKCRFGLREIEFVGHVISTLDTPSMSFSIKKRHNVGQFQLPETHKKLKSFLGLTSYFRQHVKDYVTMSHDLNDMITPYKPRQRLTWSPEQVRRFDELRDSVVNCPKLHFLVPDRPVFVQTDASDYGIGAYLFQRWSDNGTTVEQPIGFISKSLDKVQARWATVEKEAYAIYYALQKWDHHLRDIHFTLQTDHRNLLFLNEDTKPKVQRWKIQIQEYDFTLEHIAGEHNVVADGLSRHCAVDKDVASTLSLNSITPLRMDITTFVDEVQEANGFADASKLLTVNEHFEFIELNSARVLHGNVPREELPVLPRTIHQLIGRVHRTGSTGKSHAINMNGHGGVEVTIDRLHKLLDANPALRPESWTTMRKDVTTFIRKCPCCQKMALLKQHIATRPFTTASYGLHDQVAIDTIGPLPKSADGNKYILTIIDTFSRWVELIPIKDTGGETAAKAILQYIGRYGPPSSFLTDNGTQFVNTTVRELLALVEIEHCTIHPYSHEENGIVERANKEVMRHLRDIIFDARVESDWSTYVPLVQRIINSQVHSKTGLAPMELVWGKTLDLNRGILNQRDNSTENLSAWINKQIHSQKVAIQVASEKQFASDMYQIQKVNREKNFGINEPEFPIGSYVLIGYEEHEPSKLHPRLKGPMRVVAVTKRDNLPSIYTCQDLVTNKPYDYHVKLVRPFHYDAESINPETVAMADDNSFMVEEIRDHRFLNNDRKRSSLQFLVKWVGYEECTWEPYHSTFKLVQTHNYMQQNNLNSYIPRQFK